METVTNPQDGSGGGTDEQVTFAIQYPNTGDTIRMGRNNILYALSGVEDPSFELWINNAVLKLFIYSTDKGILYIDTDSIEAKLGWDPASYPSKFDYKLNVYTTSGTLVASKEVKGVNIDRRPEAPANLVLTRMTETAFNLTWNDISSNETNFEIWRKDGINAAYAKIKTIAANNFSVNDFVQSKILTYYYKIRAINSYGVSAFSNEVTSTGAQGGNAPTNLQAQALGATVIQLTWTDNSIDELGFKIQRINLQTNEWEDHAIVASNVTEYFDRNLSPGTKYEYRVAAFTSSSQTAWSDPATAVTYTIDVPPPSNLIATFDASSKTVLVQWNDNTLLENGTIIERRKGQTGSFIEIGASATDINYFTDENVEPNNIYYYRARHTTTEGFRTPYSNEDSAYVAAVPPAKPSNLQISEFVANSVYGLSWSDNSKDEDGFELWRKDGELGLFKKYRVFPSNTIAYNDTIIDPTKTYFYKIRAFKGDEYSGFTDSVSTKPFISGLNPPSKLKYQIISTVVGSKTEYKVELSWQDNSAEELGYIIERRAVTSQQFTEMKRLAPNSITWTDESDDIVLGATFIYRVKAYSAQEVTDPSNEVTVIVQ